MELATLNLNLGGGQREFRYRKSTADEAVIVQVLKNSAYNFGRLRRGNELSNLYNKMADAGKAPLIVDASPNIGASTIYFAYSFPKARVVAIESEQDKFALLSANTTGLAVKCLHAALAGSANAVAAIDPGDELHSPTETPSGISLLPQIPSVTMNDVLAANSRDTLPFILKVDVESSNGLFEADTDWVSRMPVLIIELRDSLIPGTDRVRAFVDYISNSPRDFIYLHDNIFSISREIATL